MKASADPTNAITAPDAAEFVLKGAEPDAIEDPEWKSQMSQPQKSRLYHYYGIAFCMKNNDKLALNNLRRAFQLDSSDKGIERDLLIVRQRLAAKTPKDKAAAGTVEASRLCNEPLELEPPVFTKSKFINTERYLLRKAGYQGDLLEHIEGTKPVDMEAVAQVDGKLAQLQAYMQRKKGEAPIKWIGGVMSM